MLSFLCLDAYQSVQLPQPNLGVRTNALIDTPFLLKTAETIRLGTGIPQIFNDEVVVPAFLNRGVSLEDARDYAVVGCVELSIPGRTYGLHDIAMFNLLKVMEISLYENEGNDTLTYEALLAHIRAKISHYITLMVEGSNICDIGHRDWAPVPLLSSFISDCLEKGRDITDGGARYNFSGVQGIGIANLSDSLHALNGLVFDQQRLSFDALLSILKTLRHARRGKIRARLINRFENMATTLIMSITSAPNCCGITAKRWKNTRIRAAASLRRVHTRFPRMCRWERWSARHRTGVLPENSWRMAACRRCSDRICKGRRRY